MSKATAPQGWSYAAIGELCTLINGRAFKPSDWTDTGLPIIRIQNLNNPDAKFNYFLGDVAPKFIVENGELLFAWSGTPGTSFGAHIWNGEKAILNQHIFRVLFNEIVIDKIFFRIAINQKLQELIDKAHGGVGLRHVTKGKFEHTEILLPPLNEQRRIVAKIEGLKARSQWVKEAIAAIPPLLDQFRQSVLAAAFRGDLTADWREKNPDVDWETTTLEQVIKSKPRNGYSPKPVDYPTQVKSITLSATTSGKFKPEYYKYLNEEITRDSHLWLNPGDILIQRSNTLEYVGTCAIYDGAFGEFIYPDLIMKVQVREEKTIPEFIYYTLSTKNSRQYFRNNATGTAGNMPKINQQTVMSTPIFLPKIEEQKEIVHRIEVFFKAADKIEQQYQEIKAQIDQLEQSILAKAFRGELVPQDPNDEPASMLLERIKAERGKREAQAKAAKNTDKTSGRRSRKAQQPDSESTQLELPGLE